MSHKRLKGKARELLLANGNHFSFVITFIVSVTLGLMPLVALYLVADLISEGAFASLLLAFVIFLFAPLITGIYRMAELAHDHKEYAIVDVFFAFSSVKNYFRVFLVELLGLIKLLIPVLAGFIWYVTLSAVLNSVDGIEWIVAISAVAIGILTLPFVKRFYAVSFLVCTQEMSIIKAIKYSWRYTRGISVRLTLVGVSFLPFTALSVLALMVPFTVYNFPFRLCLYSVICGELKRQYDRKDEINEVKNDICPEASTAGVEEINEQDS